MDFKIIKFRFNLNEQTIALYSNISIEELTEIISSIFNIQGKILGIKGQDKTILPLSLVCKNPLILNNYVYDIITNETNNNNSNNNSNNSNGIENNSNNILPSAPPLNNFDEINQNKLSTEEESTPTNNVFNNLSVFINKLSNEGTITRVEKEALEYLINIRSSLLPAAYSVAAYTEDSELLLSSCKNIAKNMMTSTGQSVCSAQEDILQCCDQLYINNQVDEQQLIYLRYLVLLRDEKITNLYDEFQYDRNPENLIRGLCLIAGASSKINNTNENENDNNDEEEDGDGDDEDEDYEQQQQQDDDDDEEEEEEEEEEEDNEDYERDNILNIVEIKAIIRKLSLTPVQGLLLSNMIDDDDSRFHKFYQEYLKHNNLERLKNDLTQLAKDEDRLFREDENINRSQDQDQDQNEDDGDDENEDEDERKIEIPHSPTASSRLEVLLNSLGETNKWKNTVPSRFILAVFAAAQKQLLTVGHARGLCDLFESNNELVHAAWEVFDSQGDVIDFIDTLRRIVYKATHLNLNEINDNDNNEEDNEEENEENSNNKSDSDSSDSTVPRMKSSNSSSEFNVNVVEAARNEALQAVTSAKRDLLKHSLELLAKQGLITEEAAINLFQKSLTEDCGTDDAIEDYASNKDMIVFLEKLVNLANGINPSEILQQNSNDNNNNNKNKNNLSQKEVLYISGALTTIADHLATEKIITKNAHDILKSLIQQKNSEMFNAWLSYRENKCELTTIVDLMIQLSSQNNQKSSTSTNTSSSSSLSSETNDEKRALSSDDYKNIIDIYVKAQALTSNEKDILNILVDSKNSALSQSFFSFEKHRDVHKLLSELKQIAASPIQTKSSLPSSSESDTESKFLSVVRKMNLTRDETVALRDAIANDDPLLRSALELYRSDQNEENLITNLRAICRRLMNSKSSSLSLSPTKSTSTSTATSKSPSNSNNKLKSSTQNTSKTSVSPPIQDIFPILLNELIREAIFSPEEGRKLFQLYQSNDEVMAAALDLYELDHDLSGFVGSLEKILKFI